MRAVLALSLVALVTSGCRAAAAFTWTAPERPAAPSAMPVPAGPAFVETVMDRSPMGVSVDAGVAGDAGPE